MLYSTAMDGPPFSQFDLDANRIDEFPERLQSAGQRLPQRAEDILKGDHQDADDGDTPPRQPDEAREQDHAPPEHPDDAGENERGVVDAEGPGRADDGQLEGDEQRAAGHEIAREPGRVAQLAPVQKGARAGQEDERGRAEVRDPAREEHAWRRAAGGHARIHADVIDRHQHHHGATQDVDRCNPRSDGFRCRCHRRRLVFVARYRSPI